MPNGCVLARLDRFEGLKQSELAEMLDLQPITLTRLLDRLCECGLIERRPDPNDRRAKRLFLTPAARPMLERLGNLGEELMATALAGVDRENIEKMVAQLAIVKENLRQAIQQKNAERGGENSAMAERALKSVPPAARRSAGRARSATGRAGAGPVGQARAVRQQRADGDSTASFGCAGDCSGFCRSRSSIGGYLVRHRRPDHVHRRRLCRTPRRSASRPTSPASCKDVDVTDNQHVAAGQILYRLGPRQFQIALDNAKANLAQTALDHRRR